MDALVLIVDDEPGILTALSHILGDEGWRTVTTTSGEEALELYREERPDVVFLDIWMPDRDGLETLRALLRFDPAAAVVMMSGHGTSATAVKAVKMGAYDYLEKPLSYDQAVEAVEGALRHRQAVAANESDEFAVRGDEQATEPRIFDALPELPLLQQTDEPQRTIRSSSVMYGMGLHSGRRTGMVLQPLDPDTGIHFLTVPRGVQIPAHIAAVAETDYATTITRSGESIRTVEHLLSALHAYGISNLLVKVHGEIPVLDGSALEFCDHVEQVLSLIHI